MLFEGNLLVARRTVSIVGSVIRVASIGIGVGIAGVVLSVIGIVVLSDRLCV